jgi:uncharacterized Zn finger protein (UPF0148 family)
LPEEVSSPSDGDKKPDELDKKLAEMTPPECPLCKNPDTEMDTDGPSGYCPKCGAAWANYITITLKIDKDGNQVQDDV